MNQPTLDFIHLHAADDVRQLALGSAPAGVDLRAALRQIEGRQLAARKLPSWAANDGLLFPRRLSLEQCSSEATARYKRQLVAGLLRPEGGAAASFADLTAGFGVDFAALAPLFAQALYVDRDPDLCELARHNLPCLGINHAQVLAASAEGVLDALLDHSSFLEGQASKLERVTHHSSFLKGQASKLERVILHSPLSLVMLDPARRDAAGRKVALIEDCTPDVCALQHQLRRHARHLLIKLSPMLDITAALRSLRGVTEVHVVAVHGECKEVLLVLDGLTEDGAVHDNLLDPDDVPITCMDIIPHSSFSSPLVFTRRDEEQAPLLIAPQLEEYVYEPHAAILKAGAFKTVAVRYGLRKLASQSHLYTSAHLCSDFSGRCWHVEAWSTFGKRDLRHLLSDIKGAELTVRGFPLSADALRRQLRLRQGSDAHLLATTLADGTKVLIRCARL